MSILFIFGMNQLLVLSIFAIIFFIPFSFISALVVVVHSHVWLFVTPGTAACQDSLSFTVSQSLLKLMSIESKMPASPPALYLSLPLICLLWSLWFFSPLLNLGFFCSSFSCCFRYKARLFDVFLVFWHRLVLLQTSLLALLLLHPISFELLCSYCRLFLDIFKISSLISSVTSWSFRSALFSLHVFVFFTFHPL